eukprot:CAMPEP_0176011468 /NCGR_PEP_ID=MMETSP0120_2-20121206/5299_1 /TAXON_ID=160619 /ORGANISM="Kryptoperidinium foliaceum, Strain CCMP 1326" /LENGTH=55 /DNA_ID=CAMNT_0017344331 /DNA_START=453 /DNA_END=616 /DNA_ORIENTATION=+
MNACDIPRNALGPKSDNSRSRCRSSNARNNGDVAPDWSADEAADGPRAGALALGA